MPYAFEDVVKALNEVVPYDWKGFLDQRLHALSPHAPMGGVEAAGWSVVYTDSMSAYQKALAGARETIDLRFSLGMLLDHREGKDGTITDVIPGSPAAKAGVAPGMKLVAVNGRHWSKNVLLDAVDATRECSPIELLVDNGEFYRTCKLDYRGGARYPHLARHAGAPDLLSEIVKAHAPRAAAAGK